MFFRQISDFEENFKFLDRLNVLLFNVWKDENAAAFKTSSMEQLEMFYRNYVNEMRQTSHTLSGQLNDVNAKIARLKELCSELSLLKTNASIEGCGLCYGEGQIRDDLHGGEFFVIAPGEDPNNLLAYAYERCSEIYDIDNAWYHGPL